jgi:hypothetical protein
MKVVASSRMRLGKPPTDALGFRVTVVPKLIDRACWDFFLLLSKDDQADSDQIVQDVCLEVCEDGDLFVYSSMDLQFDNDFELPVLAFSPDFPDELHWICPPDHWKN